MRIWTFLQSWAGAVLLASSLGAAADDRSDYDRRASARDLELFRSLDRDTDGAVTRAEAHRDINFLPRFDDMEVDMDGTITRAELLRYIDRHYGIPPSASAGSQ